MVLHLAILLLSAGALAYEILLMRLFSIALWHNFAYMVISLALLGYGASGTVLSLGRVVLLRHFRVAFALASSGFSVGTVICFALAQRVPFNPLELAWDPGQLVALSLLYLLLAIPFFCVAFAIGLSLMRHGGVLHHLYRADLLGAGVGCFGIVALLFLVHPTRALALVSGSGLVAAALVSWQPRRRLLSTALGMAALALPLVWPADWLAPRISEFKSQSQALRVPGSEIIAERSSPLGLLTVVKSGEIPLRHAPGLSLGFTGTLPEQIAVFSDADSMTAVTRYSEDPESLSYLEHMTPSLPYALLDEPRVLILGVGGGMEVLSARHHGAAGVDAVELDRQVARLLTDELADFAGPLFAGDSFHLFVEEARSYSVRTHERYDLVQLSLVDSFGAAAAGTHALSESYLYTVEALRTYLDRLQDGGLLAITRWLSLPPRDALKLFATAVVALEQEGVADPDQRLVWIRSWNTSTLLVKNGLFSSHELEVVRNFCAERSFDLAYAPDMREDEANRFLRLPEPYFHLGALELLGPEREAFLRRYKFSLEPATDDRPYYYRFFKWRTLPELWKLRGRGGTPLMQWSYLIVVATLAQATLAGVVLILLPLLARARDLLHPGTLRVGLYFLTLGLAFLFLEIAFMHRLTIFLGHPLYAIAVVLGSFLVFAGLGSGACQWLRARLEPWGGPFASPGWPALGAALIGLVDLVALPPLLSALIGLSDPLRIAVSIVILAPLAFLMGMPFPLGLAHAAQRHPDWLPWAWAVNGSASVVAAVLATLLAIHLGFVVLLGIGSMLYLAAAYLLRGF